MGRPTSKTELLARIETDMATLLDSTTRLDLATRESPGACDDWSVKDIAAHLDAWHEMFMEWERIGVTGAVPALPAAGYSWKETPALNEAIWLRTRDDSWDEVLARLADSHARIRKVVDGYEDGALFEKRRFAWTGTTSVGSYAVSATTSHYDWASKLIRRFVARGMRG